MRKPSLPVLYRVQYNYRTVPYYLPYLARFSRFLFSVFLNPCFSFFPSSYPRRGEAVAVRVFLHLYLHLHLHHLLNAVYITSLWDR